MAKERCLKKAFQDSLEDIKERMKEKRTKKLAKVKVTPVNKALSAKVVMINNNSVALKSCQANNKALALALEAERLKTKQAQDFILHLKREHQKLMFEIFLLRRKLTSQQGNDHSDAKLASLKDIIAKVTQNLLETANLLGPAHALCSNINAKGSTTGSDERKPEIDSSKPDLPLSHVASSSKPHTICSDTEKNLHEDILDTSVNIVKENKLPKGRRSRSHQPCLTSDTENFYLKNVSVRRQRSNLNVCREEPVVTESLEDYGSNSRFDIPEQENVATMEECSFKSSNDKVSENEQHAPNPSTEDYLLLENLSEMITSTPEPKPMPSKSKEDLVTGKEKVRKSRADVHIKKPRENSKPRASSKSRERGASKKMKEKMDASQNSGDAYDFVFEESIHVTPFRQNKQEESPNKEETSEESSEEDELDEGSVDDDLDDSLYVPYNRKPKRSSVEQIRAPVPSRPKSKRCKVQQQQALQKQSHANPEQADIKKNVRNVQKVKKENILTKRRNIEAEVMEQYKGNPSTPEHGNIEEDTPEVFEVKVIADEVDNVKLNPGEKIMGESAPPTPRFSLSDVTNLSACSGNTKAKRSCPLFHDDERKLSFTPIRKRRCTVTVNYAEPKLGRKLRRGDPFTDLEFLHSPIYKQKDPKLNSLKKKSLSRYNEAFVGCR